MHDSLGVRLKLREKVIALKLQLASKEGLDIKHICVLATTSE